MEKGEKQYQSSIRKIQKKGLKRLGLMTSWAWEDDPKRLSFTLARYKFVAKMFNGLDCVAEVGCGDGFASRIVSQAVGNLNAFDFDQQFISAAQCYDDKNWPIQFFCHDIMNAPIPKGPYDGIFSLDVMEHIEPEKEHIYLSNLCSSLSPKGRCIIGMPSLESQPYASSQSLEGHINCKTQELMKSTMEHWFQYVFMFGMNDETLHTGFGKMTHYNIALCCEPTT